MARTLRSDQADFMHLDLGPDGLLRAQFLMHP